MRAVVNSPICPLLSRPRWDCPLSDEALFGMAVEVLEQTTPGYWKVRTPYRYEGYAPARCLVPGDRAADRWDALPRKAVFHRNFADVMSRPEFQSQITVTLPLGALAAPTGEPREGWQGVCLPDGREGFVRAGALAPLPPDPATLTEGELRRRLTETARLYLRTPYRWGGKTPLGIDCSGLVFMAYLLNGIVIWRDAAMKEGFPIHPISREDLGPGDLLYFPGHVAMYLGKGQYIHATGKATSDGVVINSLDPGAPDYRPDLPGQLTAVGSYFA